MMKKESKIDLSKPRRKYYSDECSLTICPECGSDLTQEICTILLRVRSSSDSGSFMTNISGSHFCNKCPVVVFDLEKVQEGAMLGIRGGKNIKYVIAGIIDLDAISKEKSDLEIGTDDNPMPLVEFLPDLNTPQGITDKKDDINDSIVNPMLSDPYTVEGKKHGRNEPCICGSGKKYKKCCGAK